ncbi:helix-turn-helix domain-containing protein [Pseudomonas sp. NPDC089554]|uniref:helix-turn-helix domain-containing protein n=1 Tax=Pseudomonas sp. NPDC089554 TaxID=3390653 RepID=UPI003CFCDCBC
MDALSQFFERINLRGQLFYAGNVRETLDIQKPEGTALIHIVAHGGLALVRDGHPRLELDGPSVLLCPSTCRYRLQPLEGQRAEIICATFAFGTSMGRASPLGVTDTLIFPFHELGAVVPVIEALLAELQGQQAGYRKGLEVLFEYIFIVLVRQAIARGSISRGSLCAVLDPRLGKALQAMHSEPQENWTLASLAERACLSRSTFAAQFHKVVGLTPIAYLAAWRIKLACDLIRQGVALKVVADAVGYSSQAALTRAFVQEMGLPPTEWLKGQRQPG